VCAKVGEGKSKSTTHSGTDVKLDIYTHMLDGEYTWAVLVGKHM
jgi:hypothetical protein